MNNETAARLAEIRQRESAATKGPWAAKSSGDQYWRLAIWDGDRPKPLTLCAEFHWLPNTENDLRFITAARSDIPWLLDLVERQAEEVERLRNG